MTDSQSPETYSRLRNTDRVVLIGTTGAGKTTMAASIAQTLNVPHIEFDAFRHGPNWAETPDHVFCYGADATRPTHYRIRPKRQSEGKSHRRSPTLPQTLILVRVPWPGVGLTSHRALLAWRYPPRCSYGLQIGVLVLGWFVSQCWYRVARWWLCRTPRSSCERSVGWVWSAWAAWVRVIWACWRRQRRWTRSGVGGGLVRRW